MFGYELDQLRDYDHQLNGGRTHIKGAHQRLRAGEVHRPLGVSDGRKRQRDERRSHHANEVVELS